MNATVIETPQIFGNINGNLQCHVPQAINKNNGFFAEQGQWIYYYLNSDFASSYKGGLNRVKKDGPEGVLLDADKANDVENGNITVTYAKSSINIIKDWIYFESIKIERKQQDLKYITEGIYKIKIDGTEKIKVSGENATNLIAAGDWLYYSNQGDKGKIYRMRLDGTGKTKINDDNSDYLNIAADAIYYCNYSDQKKPYKISINGSKRTKLNDTSVGDLVVDGNYVYFTKFNTIDANKGTDIGEIYELNQNSGVSKLIDKH